MPDHFSYKASGPECTASLEGPTTPPYLGPMLLGASLDAAGGAAQIAPENPCGPDCDPASQCCDGSGGGGDGLGGGGLGGGPGGGVVVVRLG